MRILLASSTFAIAGALDSLIRKLKARLKDNEKAAQRGEEVILRNLTRADQQGEEEFYCEVYESKE